MEKQRTIRVGFIGLGQRGGMLIDTVLACAGTEIAAVCDPYADRVSAAAEKARAKQKTSPAEYDAEGAQMRPALIAVGNYAMTDMEMYRYLFTEEQLADPRRGTVENVRFENIRAYVEEGACFPASRIVSFYEGFAFKDISLENISFNGVRAKSAEEMELEISRVKNFRFK